MCFNSSPLFEKFANIYVKHFVGVCLCVCAQWVWQPNTLAIFIDFSHVRPPNETALRIDCIANFAQCSAENVFRII